MYWRRHVRDIVLAAAFVAAASTVVAAGTPDTTEVAALEPPSMAATSAPARATSGVSSTTHEAVMTLACANVRPSWTCSDS